MSDGIDEVLIAEDERSMREMLRTSLENAGYHVFEADDGRAALRMLQRSPCRLVAVVDADLPGASAQSILATAARDRRVGRHSFVYLTAARPEQDPPELRDALFQLGVLVLRTPFTAETLVEVLGQAARNIPAGAMPHPSTAQPSVTPP